MPADVLDVPAFITAIDRDALRIERPARSVSEALQAHPGVMVQKTGPLQHSPFIRGFTGYHNVFLIDGVRLNHSAFRPGPNQYWSTVDPYTACRLDLLRGPQGVLYGTDAVGGVVNLVPCRRECFAPGLHWNGRLATRYASAEHSLFARADVEGNHNNVGWLAGISWKRYGDLVSGAGTLPETGGIEEFDADARVDWRLSRPWTFVAAWQHVDQNDAPRTEQTIHAVPFAGSSQGTELRRNFDQQRDLVYVRLAYDAGAAPVPISRGHLTLSFHRHVEDRNRLRTGDRLDLSRFTVNQFGASLQAESQTPLGRLVYGVDAYHDELDSWKRNFVGGISTGEDVQGTIGDEGSYDLVGAFVHDRIRLGRLDLLLGARFTYVEAQADRVDNPAVAGSDPATPGNIISVSNDWTSLVGSARAVYHANHFLSVYGGVSQAFRAPTLHDLTALDATSVVETPSPDLEPEEFLSFEAGVKVDHRCVRGDLALWATRLQDNLIRSPTGVLIDGVPEVRKANIGDGYVWGVDAAVEVDVRRDWTLWGAISYMDGEVDQEDPSGDVSRRPLSRMQPLSWRVGARYSPPRCRRLWIQGEWLHSEKEDRLSFRDETDTRRIPPGGTPGWDVFNVRVGWDFNRRLRASLSLENLLDENYRIHGSGVNEPGFNVVLAAEALF